MNKKDALPVIHTCPSGQPCDGPDGRTVLTELLTEQGPRVVLDTCGNCGLDVLLEMADHAELVLFDLKAVEPVRHQRYTGHSNRRILDNLRGLARHLQEQDAPTRVWIRTPLVPGTTACDGNLISIGQFIAQHLGDVVERWELCAFDNPAADAYRRLGLDWPWGGRTLMAPRELQRLCLVARSSGVDPAIVDVVGVDCASES